MVANDPIVINMEEVKLPAGMMVISVDLPDAAINAMRARVHINLHKADVFDLRAGKLIALDMEKMGLPKGELLIYHGESVQDMNRKLREAGLVTDDMEQTFHPGWNQDENKPLTEGDGS